MAAPAPKPTGNASIAGSMLKKGGNLVGARPQNEVVPLKTVTTAGEIAGTGASLAEKPDAPKAVADLAGKPLRKPDATTNNGGERADTGSDGEIDMSAIAYQQDILIGEIRDREKKINDLPKMFWYNKPIKGPVFYFILGLVILKDIVNIFQVFEIVDPTALIWILEQILNGLTFACTWLYFYIQGVPMDGKKQKVQVLGWLIELVPILGCLPTETIAFIWVRIEANRDAKQRQLDKMNEEIERLQGEVDQLRGALDELGMAA